jgi:hypothetical protein
MIGPLQRRSRIKGLRANDPQPCYQLSLVRTGRQCSRCGEVMDVAHIPTLHSGHFCGRCCPACGPAAGEP